MLYDRFATLFESIKRNILLCIMFHRYFSFSVVFLFPLQKIKYVYTSEFKPYVVFVKPPRIEELRLTRRRAKFVCDEDSKQVRMFSVSQHAHLQPTISIY